MEADAWSFRVSTSSRSFQSSNFCTDLDEFDEEDELKAEYPCPFCPEDFDLIGLRCHIEEEHALESVSGVCPVCFAKVETNMLGHVTTQHGTIFKDNSHQKLNLYKDDNHSALPPFKKEFNDLHLSSVFSRSPSLVSSKMAPDPLVSFLSYGSSAGRSENLEPAASSSELTSEECSLDEKVSERNAPQAPLSDKEQMEKANKCEFLQGLLFSAMFGGNW